MYLFELSTQNGLTATAAENQWDGIHIYVCFGFVCFPHNRVPENLRDMTEGLYYRGVADGQVGPVLT